MGILWPFNKAYPIPNWCGGTEPAETGRQQERICEQPTAGAPDQSGEAQNDVGRDKNPGNDSATPLAAR